MSDQAANKTITHLHTSQHIETKSVLIGIHFSMKLTKAIDAFIADHFNMMKRPEAIRAILIESLAAKGYLQRDQPYEKAGHRSESLLQLRSLK